MLAADDGPLTIGESRLELLAAQRELGIQLSGSLRSLGHELANWFALSCTIRRTRYS